MTASVASLEKKQMLSKLLIKNSDAKNNAKTKKSDCQNSS